MRYIITADWHLRSTCPRCRLDENWIETQRKALMCIASYAKEYAADVIVIGDIFHSTNETTNEIIGLAQELAITLKEIDKKLYILAGNHDLPQHNLDNIYRSAFQILLNSRNVYHIKEIEMNDCKFKYNPEKISAVDFGADENYNAEFVFKHALCFPENAKLPPSDKIVKPSELFALFNNAKYIFTGDYHRQFVYKKGAKYLLNPGCLIRQAADMIDYAPSVFMIDFSSGKFEYKICLIPDDEKMITDEYLEKEEMRNGRIDAFIERIKDNEQVTFDFIENVHNLLKTNKIDAEIKKVILELMENT